MFVGYVFAARLENDARLRSLLEKTFGAEWQTKVHVAPSEVRRAPRSVVPDVKKLIGNFTDLRKQDRNVRMGVIFVLDMRPSDVEELIEALRYKAPRLEVVALSSKDLHAGRLDFWLRYFGLRPGDPANVAEALRWFSSRFQKAIVLPAAIRSAEEHRSFERPDLVLRALHVLARVNLDWAETRRAARQPMNHIDLTELSDPPVRAMRVLMEEATFDASDSSDPLVLVCPDEAKRDFRWHVKLSLAGPQEERYHWRGHYVVDRGASCATLYLGHCGIHR